MLYVCTHAQSTVSDLRTPENVSKAPSSPGRSAEMCTEEPERLKNPLNASGMCMHAHSDQINAKATAKTAESISTPQNRPKTPNSPLGVKGWHIDEADGLGNIADGLIECREM